MNVKKCYLVTICDDFNHVTLTGEFWAEDEETAAEKAQGSYAVSLDTDAEWIQVLSVAEKVEGRQYPESILQVFREIRGLEEDDTSRDAEIYERTPNEIFEAVLVWHGILGYTEIIKGWVKDIYGVNLDK